VAHPLKTGQLISSPGCHFTYRIIGPCCRLFDREQLPWPCCRLEWGGKEPSWRRIGKRFVLDMATQDHPSYSVEILGYGSPMHPPLLTLYWVNLSADEKEWWYAKKPQKSLNQPFPSASGSAAPAK
jgi:hypothetical protein